MMTGMETRQSEGTWIILVSDSAFQGSADIEPALKTLSANDKLWKKVA